MAGALMVAGAPVASATANVGQNNLTYVCSQKGAWSEAPSALAPNSAPAYTSQFPASGTCDWYNDHYSNTNILVVDLTTTQNYSWYMGFAAWSWDSKYNPMVQQYNPYTPNYVGVGGSNQVSRLQFVYYRPSNPLDSTLQAACSNPDLGAYQTIYVCERKMYEPYSSGSAGLNGQTLFDFTNNGRLRTGAIWFDPSVINTWGDPATKALHVAVHELGHLAGAEHDYQYSFPTGWGCAVEDSMGAESVMSTKCDGYDYWPNNDNYTEARVVYY